MGDQLLKKLADELKETREKKKITIDQIFTKTRIDKKYLSAIEEGNFSLMPDVYIRAFLKEYAKTIGADAAEVLSKYEMAQKGIDFEEPAEEVQKPVKQKSDTSIKTKISKASELDTKREAPESETNSNKTVYYALAGILMLVFIIVIYKTFLTEQNTEIITEKPFDEIMQSQSNDTTTDTKESTDYEKKNIDLSSVESKKVEFIKSGETDQEKTNDIKTDQSQTSNTGELTLTILGSDKSWIRVVTDEKDNMEFIIDKGITKVLSAKNKFYLHIGNSGGVKLLMNNKELNFSGAQGKVRKIFVTKDGIEYLRKTPVENAENG